MPDNAKSPKNLNSPKTVTPTDVDLNEEKKEKPLKEIPVIHDEGFFQHDTGDTYDGEFEAKKKEHSAKMHGQGVYTTAEGDRYTGHWEADRLVATGVTIISFNDGSKFEGLIKEWGYTGLGKYTYPDGSVLTGEFLDNCPVGQLVLTDPNGHIWLGKAEQGYGWFEPVNHFYEMLDTSQSRTKRHHISDGEVQVAGPPSNKVSPTPKSSPTSRASTSAKGSSAAKSSQSLRVSLSLKGFPTRRASASAKGSSPAKSSQSLRGSPSLKGLPTGRASASAKGSSAAKSSQSLRVSPSSLKSSSTIKGMSPTKTTSSPLKEKTKQK